MNRALDSTPLQSLRRLAKPRVARESCELCSIAIAPEHRHLLQIAERKIVCVCDPCALSFQCVVGGRYKLIPRDVRPLLNFKLSDAQWDGLAIPINLAFFFRSASQNKMRVFYPGPAGATESLLSIDNWEMLAEENPALTTLESDVEALLVHRVGATREHCIAPIDKCFELVGLIRMHWRGLSGGEKVWDEIEKYFAALKNESTPSRTMESERSRA